MPTSVTPLTARSQTLVSAALVAMAVMGFLPFLEVYAVRAPLRFAELPWRYDTMGILLSTGPNLVILLGIIGVIGAVVGYRRAVRFVAIVLGVVAIVNVILAPLLLLDYFQMRRLVAQTRAPVFKAQFVKTLLASAGVAAVSAWVALRGWQASESESAGHRRTKGEGLVVGQAEGPESKS